MAGNVSSLGIGSGVLTADIIDQLREADEERIIKPLDGKIEFNKQKETAFTLLDTLMTGFKGSASALDDDGLYQNRAVAVNNEAVKVTAEAGSDVQSFTIDNVLLAQADIQDSAVFASKTTAISPSAPGNGVLTLDIGSNSYAIDYTAATTLEGLAQAINDAAGESVTASVLQVGADSYELVVQSDNTGADQAITFTDSLNDGSNDADSLLTQLGMSSVQTARDASFNYNGIAITRSTNDVSDLLNGVTITLQEEGESSNIAISQNKEDIRTEMSLFVENYNNLVTNLHDMTLSDRDAGTAGVFNGDNFIKSISRDLNNIITSMDVEGQSLVDYGIDIDKYGFMTFDSSVFDAKLDEDPAALESFFSGSTDPLAFEEEAGIFTTLKEKINTYTKFNGLFDNYENSMKSQMESLTEQRTKQIETLDNRYEIMAKRFVAYDAIISKINTQFSSLEQMIAAELNQDS